MLRSWAIPEDLVEAAPASPYFFSPTVFGAAADAALDRGDDTPSDSVACDALPDGGTVLDVGVGAGAASLRLPAGHVIGVDPNAELLDAFVLRAERRGMRSTAIRGAWPDVESETPNADVAVCHHVVYNVADLAGFVAALTSHAEHRVVVELTAVHPMTWMAPYWQGLHHVSQPDRPTADDAILVLARLGLDVHQQRWQRPVQMIGENEADAVARIARRLCLAPDRHDELAQVLARTPPPTTRDVVTLWWGRDRDQPASEAAWSGT
ncbi:MAG TPA: class I SAM-dependent methyltransferase [Acidimicrobiales bacterium]|nr:class I SAM-dependent methyltransferase [Acidimicrobiales bacterium]